MEKIKRLLVTANLPSVNCIVCRDAMVEGAMQVGSSDVEVSFKEPLAVCVEDVVSSDGVIIGTTENFGAMSGLIKDLFERIYYSCMDVSEGLPVALYIKAGLDGEGAKTGMQRIITGLRWKLIQPPLVLKGQFIPQHVEQCRELGMTVASGLAADIY